MFSNVMTRCVTVPGLQRRGEAQAHAIAVMSRSQHRVPSYSSYSSHLQPGGEASCKDL
jgi:hypothetical protein